MDLETVCRDCEPRWLSLRVSSVALLAPSLLCCQSLSKPDEVPFLLFISPHFPYVFVGCMRVCIHTFLCVHGPMGMKGHVNEGPGLLSGICLHSSSTFYLIHQGRVSRSNPLLSSVVSLVSQCPAF